nr:5773_t:CDS:2 [Entrophospora candida]
MNSLPPLPNELKFISPYLQRAQELQQREPIIAYYCNYYAAKLAIEKGTKEKGESQNFLFKLLDVLEKEKKKFSNNEAVTNDIVGEAFVENFAIKIFLNADNIDRAGKATKQTAMTFLASSIFLELLKIFGELSPEVENKIKYAKWKAAHIIKALRDGQRPIAGPPGGDPTSQEPTYVDNVNTNAAPLSNVSTTGPPLPPKSNAIQPFNYIQSITPTQTAPSSIQPHSQLPQQQRTPNATTSTGQQQQPTRSTLNLKSNSHCEIDPNTVATAQKYCKWAVSALNYNDVKTAIENIDKAKALLESYNN